VRKILIKFMDVGNPIWNTFYDYNFLRFSTVGPVYDRFHGVPLDLLKFLDRKVYG
jgi:hypothetical protein